MAVRAPGILRLDREGETSPKRLAILVGIGAALLFVVLWAFSGDDPAEVAAPPPAPVAAPAPVITSAPSAVRTAPAQPAASASGLTLHGVMGFGADAAAIIAVNGKQRLVRVGRDVLPGLPLDAVAADHVIVLERGNPVRVAFPEALNPTQGAPTGRVVGSGRTPDEAATRERIRRETIEYQLGFEPRREDGRITGFTIRRGAVPPLFARAGLRPGDVVTRVAGDPWRSTENISELAGQIAYRETIEIEFERGGRKRTVSVNREAE